MDDEIQQVQSPAERNFQPFTAGPYHVIEQIGDGGMGVVYLAEQLEPIQRLVTLKTVRPDLDVSGIVQRFEIERQNLARMNHPNIAQILDAGSLPDGKPYLVMEFVRGESLSRYCFCKRLDIPSRLELIIELCEAVQHAHQKGVVHKDLKPDNVLVTDIHGRPHIKVIDFGISKLLDTGNDSGSIFSALSLIGTPQYMSPEQRGRLHLDVDTRTDVYSIGIILYELLCSVVPIDLINMVDISEALRKLLRPSEQVRQSLVDLSSNRRMKGSRQLMRALRGDLDAIVLKAIKTDRNDRYQTPAALAEELRRYLIGRPIAIRRHESAYVIGKLIERHKIVSGTILLALLSISVLFFFLVSQIHAAERARLESHEAYQRHESLQELIIESFTIASPWNGEGHEITARDLMKVLAQRLDSRQFSSRVEQSVVYIEAARFFNAVEERNSAERFARQAIKLLADHETPDPTHVANARVALAEILSHEGKYREAIALLEDAIAVLQAEVGDAHKLVLEARILLAHATLDNGNVAVAERIAAGVVATLHAAGASDEKLQARAYEALAACEIDKGNYVTAKLLLDNALIASLGGFGERHLQTQLIRFSMIYVQQMTGDLHGAEIRLREAHSFAVETFGPDSADTAALAANLGANLNSQHRFTEAETFLDAAFEVMRRINGDEHPQTLTVRYHQAVAAFGLQEFPKAGRLAEEVLQTRLAQYGDADVRIANVRKLLGRILLARKNYEEALKQFRVAMKIYADDPGSEDRLVEVKLRILQARLLEDPSSYSESEFNGAILLLESGDRQRLEWARALRRDLLKTRETVRTKPNAG